MTGGNSQHFLPHSVWPVWREPTGASSPTLVDWHKQATSWLRFELPIIDSPGLVISTFAIKSGYNIRL